MMVIWNQTAQRYKDRPVDGSTRDARYRRRAYRTADVDYWTWHATAHGQEPTATERQTERQTEPQLTPTRLY